MQHSILCPGHATAPPPHPCARRHVCACACPSGASSSSSSSGRGSFRGTHVPNGTNDSGRRALLASGASALLLAPVVQLVSQAPPAEAAVTLNIKSKARLRPANIKAGYLISIPDSFSVAYDRSDGQDAGTAFFCGNFKTFEVRKQWVCHVCCHVAPSRAVLLIAPTEPARLLRTCLQTLGQCSFCTVRWPWVEPSWMNARINRCADNQHLQDSLGRPGAAAAGR